MAESCQIHGGWECCGPVNRKLVHDWVVDWVVIRVEGGKIWVRDLVHRPVANRFYYVNQGLRLSSNPPLNTDLENMS